jgi:hypothetical protein
MSVAYEIEIDNIIQYHSNQEMICVLRYRVTNMDFNNYHCPEYKARK